MTYFKYQRKKLVIKVNQDNKITVFGLNLNNYFSTPLHKMCVDSWFRWKANNSQITNIIIFNEESKEYKEFLNIYNTRKYKNKDSYVRLADAFRMYILSIYKNYLWLDGDVYIDNINLQWNLKFYFQPCWYCLYNGDNLDYYKKVFNLFITENLGCWIDEDICARYQFLNSNHVDIKGLAHLCWLEHELLAPPYIIKPEYPINNTIARLWPLRHRIHNEIETNNFKSNTALKKLYQSLDLLLRKYQVTYFSEELNNKLVDLANQGHIKYNIVSYETHNNMLELDNARLLSLEKSLLYMEALYVPTKRT